jgi:hypothetical protein
MRKSHLTSRTPGSNAERRIDQAEFAGGSSLRPCPWRGVVSGNSYIINHSFLMGPGSCRVLRPNHGLYQMRPSANRSMCNPAESPILNRISTSLRALLGRGRKQFSAARIPVPICRRRVGSGFYLSCCQNLSTSCRLTGPWNIPEKFHWPHKHCTCFTMGCIKRVRTGQC